MMIRLAVFCFAATGTFLVAEAPPSVIDGWQQMTAVGVLGFVAIWTVVKIVPVLKKDNDEKWKELVSLNKQTQAAIDRNTDAVTTLKQHCADTISARGE